MPEVVITITDCRKCAHFSHSGACAPTIFPVCDKMRGPCSKRRLGPTVDTAKTRDEGFAFIDPPTNCPLR